MNKDKELLDAIVELQSYWVEHGASGKMFNLLLNTLLELTSSEYGFFGEVLYTEEKPYLKILAINNSVSDEVMQDFDNTSSSEELKFYKLNSLYGKVLTTGAPVMINAWAEELRWDELPAGYSELNSFVGMPFYYNGEILGMVGIANRSDGYDEHLIDYLSPFLKTCAHIISSFRKRNSYILREEKLRGREKVYADILDALPVGIFVIDVEEKPYYLNQTAINIVGDKLSGDFCLKDLSKYCHAYAEKTDQLYPSARMPITKALQGETASCSDIEIRQGEKHIPLHVKAIPLKDHTGNVNYAIAIFNDISELKQQQAEVVEKEALLSAIFDNAIDALFTIDEKGEIIRVNPAAQTVFGYCEEELMGQNITLLMPEPHRSLHGQYLQNYLSTGENKIIGIGREVEAIRKDESVFPCDLAVSEINLYGKHIFTGVLRDISERKRIEQMKKEFIATVSHELRTPLTSIHGALGLLRSETLDTLEPLAQELLGIALVNSNRLILLVNDILDMEKLEAGALKFDIKIYPLTSLIELAVVSNQTYAEQHNSFIEISENLPQVSVAVDQHRYIQVLTNLLSNAAKFSPEGRPVKIEATANDDIVCVSIIDEGPGIPESFKDKIFNKFSQVEDANSQKTPGTGLGLSISRELTEKMGGKIGFDSNWGKGSRFYVELPVYSSQQQPTSTSLESEIPTEDQRHRILVCEDDPDVAKILKIMLEKYHFQVDIALNWTQARKQLANQDYAAMTLDLMLPDQSYSRIFQDIRQDMRTRDLPVIVVSAKADEANVEFQGDVINVIDWLSKPINEERLIDAAKLSLQIKSGSRLPCVLYIETLKKLKKSVEVALQDLAEVIVVHSIIEANEQMSKMNFDLVIINLDRSGQSELLLLPRLSHSTPPIPVVIFSEKDMEDKIITRAQEILLKSKCSPETLLETIQSLINSDK
ncbi:MAG: PAS domain S-box protein [Methyloprofundus sp.]|nr:PAS domain S-box protein [Methyloprofundus sp.]